jgi:hypothetical protein
LSDIGCYVDLVASSTSEDANTLTLDKLGISHLDFVSMCNAIPDGAGNSEIEIRIRRYIRSQRSVEKNNPPGIDLARRGTARFSVADAMEFGRAFLDMFGNAAPLAPASLAHPETTPPGPFYTRGADAMKMRADKSVSELNDQVSKLDSTNASDVLAALDVCAAYGIQEALVESADDASIIARATTVSGIAAKRVNKAEPLIKQAESSADSRIPLLVSAFKALFGESFIVLPEFEAQHAPRFNGSTMKVKPASPRVSLWFQQVAETHPRVRSLETLLMCAAAWRNTSGSDMTEFRVAQLPPSPEHGWQALSDSELTGTAGRLEGSLSIVAIGPESFDNGNVAGFVIDDWTETIPAPKATTGISFEYNQPNSQAPHCFLLAVPGNFDKKVWSQDHLAAIVRDTMDLAKVRLVDLDALPRVTGVFPALMFPIGSTVPKTQAPPLRIVEQTETGSTPGVSQQGGEHAVSGAR